jgi:hypothetical protein
VGLEPLHLSTFLRACLIERLAGKAMSKFSTVFTAICAATSNRHRDPATAAAVVLEERHGRTARLRSNGSW